MIRNEGRLDRMLDGRLKNTQEQSTPTVGRFNLDLGVSQ